MAFKVVIFIVSCMVGLSLADEPKAPAAYAPPQKAAPAYNPPASHHAPQYPDVAPSYAYTYNVNDKNTYTAFEASENREGYSTSGSYRVNLPDGRVQIVTYKADENGYVADVKYEGKAVYPEYKPTYKSPHPAHADHKKTA